MAGMAESVVTALSGYFHEFADREEDSPGLPLPGFCNFLAYGRLVRSDFDHSRAVEVFLDATDGEADAAMDLQTFRTALQNMASRIYVNQLFGGNHKAAHESTMKIVALQELLRDIALRRGEDASDRKEEGLHGGDLQGLLHDIEMIRAVYAYAEPVSAMFVRYALGGNAPQTSTRRNSTFSRFGDADPGLMSGRSVYRLCRSTGLVPEIVVAGELVDVARELALLRRGHLFPAEHRFFDEELMTSVPENSNWQVPERSKLTGELHYNFPQLMELLAAVALWMPPRVHLEPAKVRVQRVHEVFGRCFGPPTPVSFGRADRGAAEVAEAEDGEGIAYAWAEAPPGMQPFMRKSTTAVAVETVPLEMEDLLARLRGELPCLPPPQGPQVPAPAAAAPLHPPPATAEEKIEAARKALFLKGPRGGGGGASRKKKSAKGKKGRSEPAFAPPGDVNKVTWYARPQPQLPRGVLPPEHRGGRRVEQFELFQSGLDRRRRQIEGYACPETGWVLRMGLIDEPLRAPRCASEEVSTLIETALTSRRLRHYDTSAAMLIEARRLWIAHEAGADAAAAGGLPQPSLARSSASSPGASCSGVERGEASATASVLETPWPERQRSSDEAHSASADSQARGSSHHAGSHARTRGSSSARGEASWEAGLAQRRYRPDADFVHALGHLDEGGYRLPPEAGLFFLCELASLHSAMHEDQLALQLLWRAKLFSERLSARNPDSAAIWCSLCRAAYYAGHHDIAARSAARARVIREETLGEDTVETATVYNNLACCLSALDRPLEAAAYLDLAVEILRTLAGEEHPRTQTAARNLDKARSAQKHLSMRSPNLFSFPVQAQQLNAKQGKKKKKGRRRSSSSRRSGSSKRSSTSRSSRGSRKSSGKVR